MIDPIDSLAFSISSNKNVYALLIGSGVSRAAEIPTGWEIVLDMMRKLAVIHGENADLNPEEWYRKKYNEEPNYSSLLNMIVKTKTERSFLLRQYFEPNDEERESGKKLPTAAHVAIAKLVEEGYINVIVTTNFDRLLEKELDNIGITPVVISTRDQIIGASPISRNKCTVLKVHGDYLDSRIKNTPDELSKYEPSINRYLDKIFDEYGLIICGWSGEWDIALRNAIYRRKSRRYSYYWTLYGEINGTINSIISCQSAQIVIIVDADTFFTQLHDKVSAIDKYQSYHPLSKVIAISRVKKYLLERNMIYLNDLINQETDIFYKKIYDNNDLTKLGLTNKYFTSIEAWMEVLHSIFCTCCYWGDESIIPYIIKIIEKLTNKNETYNWPKMDERIRLFPSMILLYSGGIIALSLNNYFLLGKLLSIEKRINPNEYEPLVNRVNVMTIFEDDKSIEGYGNHLTPLSDLLFEKIYPMISDHISDPHQYEMDFDRFEYLVCIFVANFRMKNGDFWAPVGRFVWKTIHTHFFNVINDATSEIYNKHNLWGILSSSLFEKDINKLIPIQEKLVEYIDHHRLRSG